MVSPSEMQKQLRVKPDPPPQWALLPVVTPCPALPSPLVQAPQQLGPWRLVQGLSSCLLLFPVPLVALVTAVAGPWPLACPSTEL